MAVTTHLSLASPNRNALLDVIDDAEAAFFEYGLAPDISGVQTLAVTVSGSTEDGHRVTDDDLPDHFSSEFTAEISQFHADRVYYAAMRGLPVIGRIVREETPSRPNVVIQSNRQTGSGPSCRVYRHDKLTGDYELLSDADSRLG
ncbi:hypothetical protein ABNG02_16035 [Halorubrum ejinorense]|uniref:Uncharacterized protein n=1 Tax=Halorubrum ejinorense TaxID=425309 RepID=A0AAV3STT8_9EURY